MTYAMTSALPDPDYDAVFYDGVPAKRFFAWIVDVILITAMGIVLGLLTLTLLFWVWPILFLTLSFLYRSLTIAAGSATLGMRLMNLELRGPTGARLTGTEAVWHTGAYLLCVSFALPQIISAFLIVTGRRHQGLHDLFLGTVAINRPR